MPESKKRKKNGRVASEDTEIKPSWTDGMPLSPAWWAPTFIALLILGLVWLMVYYISGAQYPVPGIGAWNMGIGIALMMVGFLMTLKWR